MLGYRTAARVAAAEGAEHRAFELLDTMHAVGLNRGLPRMCVASLSDQVRMHARRFRPETSRALCARIDALLASDEVPKGRLWRRSADWLQHLAHANAAIAAQDWRQALAALDRTAALVQSMQYGRVRIEVMALRAYALDQIGEKSLPLLREAIDLAQTFGLQRLFRDAHPALAEWVQQVLTDRPGGSADRATATRSQPPAAPMQASRPTGTPRAIPSLALTPKEREVLELLARNLSNKEIARAMQIGEETIKWHLKNLFSKLDAGTRKQAVRRAEVLGLLETAH
jgi:LuxR family maltose regulon positive regulatory protein